MQVDDVGLLELRQSCDVGAGVGDVDGKEILSREVEAQEDAPTFPRKFHLSFHDRGSSATVMSSVSLSRTSIFGLHAVVVECFAKAIGCHGRTACFLARTDY